MIGIAEASRARGLMSFCNSKTLYTEHAHTPTPLRIHEEIKIIARDPPIIIYFYYICIVIHVLPVRTRGEIN